MNTTNKKFTMGLLTAISAFIQSCTNGWDSFHEGVVEGKKYVVQARSVSNFLYSSGNTIEYRLRFGELPFIPINAHTTDWDVVYSTDIFGQDDFEYITTTDIAYRNDREEEEVVSARTFLYLLPKDFSKQEYKEYARFFKSTEWQKADSICVDKKQSRFPFPHIVGLVHGDPTKYTQDFKGSYLGQEYIFRVENDGRVRLVDGGELGELGTGLSPKVQMPDKIIYFLSASPGAITIDDLTKFKNKHGRTPLDHFKFLQK
jgi:hypothetical protein